MKKCRVCLEEKELTEFYQAKSGYYLGRCKECTKKGALEWRKSHPEEWKSYRRAVNLRRKYGITREQYDDMMIDQGGKCKVCGKSYLDEHQHLSVDHNHKTGKVRGLLCNGCNVIIGKIENKDLLESIINYLSK